MQLDKFLGKKNKNFVDLMVFPLWSKSRNILRERNYAIFPGLRKALDNVSFDLPKGSNFA